MIKHMTKLTGWTAALAAVAATASADVKVNDYLTFTGYAAASGTFADTAAGNTHETLFNTGSPELDVVNVGLVGKYQDFGGKLSLLYVPTRTGGNAGVLDAYVTYTKADFVVTAGNFLSWLGYESFYTPNMTQMTYAANIGAIPAYHTGVKVDYTISKTLTAGVAIVDSEYNTTGHGWAGYAQGDGHFDSFGTEAYVSYTGIDKLTLWAGFGYDDNQVGGGQTVIGDVWASYALSSKVTLAGEVTYVEQTGSGYLTEVQYAFSDKLTGIFRWSGAHAESGDTGTYLTVSPSYKVTSNLTVRGEVSYADSAEATAGTYGLLTDTGFFYGVQGIFTF